MSSKHRLLFPFIFVVLVAGWLVGAVALAASSSQGTASHQAAASRHRRGTNTAPVLSVTNNVISWPSQSGATGFKAATSTGPRGASRTSTYQNLGLATTFKPTPVPGATRWYGVASEGSAGDLWSSNEVEIAWPPNVTTSSTTSSTTTTSPTSTSTSTTTSPTSTSTTTTSPTSTTTSSTTTSGPQPASGIPHPGGGSWTPTFDDEFNGTALNTAVWGYYPGGSSGNNNLTSDPALVTESGGFLNLSVSGSDGGMVTSGWAEDFAKTTTEGASKGYALPVGGYVEARIKFEGSGSTIYGWPAFWASRRLSWPQSGEFDIAEGYDGLLGPGYWQGTSKATAFGTSGPKASFPAAGTFHTYAVYRGASVADFYYDGTLQWSEPTHDNGTPASIFLETGSGDTNGINAQPQPNASGISMQVDYVRAWQ
jgi:hypothetical protein